VGLIRKGSVVGETVDYRLDKMRVDLDWITTGRFLVYLICYDNCMLAIKITGQSANYAYKLDIHSL
jgi:hypothetical protein